MGRRRKKFPVFEQVEVMDAGAEGKAVARVDDMVIFIPWVAPGDIIDVMVTRRKKSFYEGKAVRIHHYSEKRADPFCKHFGTCGGCKWQHLTYENQLLYKQKQVEDSFARIGKLDHPEVLPILPSENTNYYRNKLEYTFSNRRWLTGTDRDASDEKRSMDALGFHIPGMFDRVVNIEHCWLQQDPSNKIRLELRDYVLQKGYSFYDVKKWTGLLRNLIIRNTSTGELMVIVVFREKDDLAIADVMGFLDSRFPEINALMYVVNGKKNDQISDLEVIPYSGRDHIIEEMPAYMKGGEPLKFKIGPVSFFQTNSLQAYQLYRIGLDFADFSGDEVVYDLYTGTGTIANYIAGLVKRVVGIEYVPSAIEDAEENARFNGISNTSFFAGDMVKVLDDSFIEENGQPDVVITDPPRAGMHEKVVHQIIKMAPEKIIYISCNPATQARDIALMDPCYEIMQIRPVDMFPHTQHVENVVSLRRRETTLNSKFQIPNPKQIPNSKAPHPLNPPAPFSPSP